MCTAKFFPVCTRVDTRALNDTRGSLQEEMTESAVLQRQKLAVRVGTSSRFQALTRKMGLVFKY